MKAMADLLVHTLGPVLYVLLLGGALLGVIIGVLLLVDSERVMRWNYALNRWYSTRQAMRGLERPIDVKRPFYRWHRVLGAVVFAASLYTLDVLVFGFHTSALVRALRGSADPALLSLVLEAVRLFLIAGNLAALIATAVLVLQSQPAQRTGSLGRPPVQRAGGYQAAGCHALPAGRLRAQPTQARRRPAGARERVRFDHPRGRDPLATVCKQLAVVSLSA